MFQWLHYDGNHIITTVGQALVTHGSAIKQRVEGFGLICCTSLGVFQTLMSSLLPVQKATKKNSANCFIQHLMIKLSALLPVQKPTMLIVSFRT